MGLKKGFAGNHNFHGTANLGHQHLCAIWRPEIEHLDLFWLESNPTSVFVHCIYLTHSHRAMFKLGGKNLIVLCLLIKIVSAVSSADRCNSKESEKAVWDLNWIGGDISSDTAHNSEHFSHFRFPIPVANWQFLIKVWTYVIGLSCLLRTMLEYQKVRQVWTLQHG